jgi:hypothetical protein
VFCMHQLAQPSLGPGDLLNLRVVSQTDLCWTTMNGGKLNGGQLLWGGAHVCVYFLTIRASPPLLLL